MRRFLRDNGLGLLFGGLFLITLIGQAFAGQAQYNDQQISNGAEPVSLTQYVTSSTFAVDVVENWQSEYLQFFLYIFLTVWLVQRGSPESKNIEKIGTETDVEQKTGLYARDDSPAWARETDWRGALFSRSLGIVMGTIFLLSWLAQSVTGWAAYNSEQLGNRQDPVTWLGYLSEADFWNRTLQNWQSEMLRWAPWPSSGSTCASVARRSRSRWGRRTRIPAKRGKESGHGTRPPPRVMITGSARFPTDPVGFRADPMI